MQVKHRLDPPSAARRGAARARLIDALATVTARTPTPSAMSVAELCRRANVSRNSLYRYHVPVLTALRQHQGPKSARARALRSAERHRTENALLRDRLTKLAALVDHYFAAYREATILLARRERELADLRQIMDSRPAMLPSSAHGKDPDASARPGPI